MLKIIKVLKTKQIFQDVAQVLAGLKRKHGGEIPSEEPRATFSTETERHAIIIIINAMLTTTIQRAIPLNAIKAVLWTSQEVRDTMLMGASSLTICCPCYGSF